MADATVSIVLNKLAPLIDKRVRQEVDRFLNAKDEALNLSSKLQKNQAVLADAVRKEVTDPRVGSWLDKLKDIACEIDDALDEWEVESIKQRLEESEDASDSWEKKVCSFLQSACLCFKEALQRRHIALDISRINRRLDSIAQENESEFKFIPNAGHGPQEFKRILPTSFVDMSEIHGRDHDKKTLVSKLLESSAQEEDDIKTTIAQLIFNDVQVNEQFEAKIWICVSDLLDEIKIAKAILETLNESSPNLSEFEKLLQCLKKSVSGKKFLVLEDVWTEDDITWRQIRVSLKNGAPRSRILVTTRKEKVAKIMGSIYLHSLKPLESMYCWSILSQIALVKEERANERCSKKLDGR